MRIVFIGTVKLSAEILKEIIALKYEITGIVTKKTSGFNADFCDLSPIARANNIARLYVKDINNEYCTEWIRARKPDVIFCCGLSQKIGDELLSIAPGGIIGYHPAELPEHRGRHPLVWALVLGLRKTASTFFFIDSGIDSGNIISAKKIKITYADDAATLYRKIIKTAVSQVRYIMPLLKKGGIKRYPQNKKKAGSWRKRSWRDGEIDFRMSSRTIYNLVRALARPYVGAHVMYQEKPVKVWKVKEVPYKNEDVEFGKVIQKKGDLVCVRCADGAVCLVEHEFKKVPKPGDYIL